MGTIKDADRAKALDLALKAIEKNIGKGSIITGNEPVPGVDFISSGSIMIDRALGGGWARGRIIEVFGPESSGKTTLCLHAIAEAQAAGLVCAFVDAEHALDPIYMEALGVNMGTLLLSQPDNGEDALETTRLLMKSNAVDLIVIDSIAALTPKAELEGEIGDSHVGRQARLMGQAMRMLAAGAHNTNTTLMFINQIRMKVGVMFGNPETTPGGNALKYYSSQRIDIRRTGAVKDKEEVIGCTTKLKVVKNKVAPPFRVAEFEIKYGHGIDKLGELLDMAVNLDLIHKAGAWYSYNEENIAQGKPNAIKFLEEHPEIVETIKETISGIH